ncbi:hypothetical protein ACFXKS_01170 [Streptomyces scopuliridis]|uniref:hypothetical protein n=1 Tax=Streptomyces scopuliridis TaxID=452529 RepID=UPI0036968C75
MRPDLVQLRGLIEESPTIFTLRGEGLPEARILAAESVVGPLPPSYRWWLAEYGGGSPAGAPAAAIDLTTAWRLDGDLLRFCTETGTGDTYQFVLGRQAYGEYAVTRRGADDADEEYVADSFAGFLTVRAARHLGLGAGPTPAVARLWRSTPGVLLPNGVLVYGPQDILERNETYEVGDYALDWILIGDNSGGSGLFMRRHGHDRDDDSGSEHDRATVYLLDLGAGERDIDTCGLSEPMTDDLLDWLRHGAVRP